MAIEYSISGITVITSGVGRKFHVCFGFLFVLFYIQGTVYFFFKDTYLFDQDLDPHLEWLK